MIIKTNFIVISGGPGSGKTSLIRTLQEMGFTAVDETGRTIIKHRLAVNLPARPSPYEFAFEMFQQDLSNFSNNIHEMQPVFFDRSFLDSAALLKQADPGGFGNYQHILNTNRFFDKVFLAPPWKEIYRNDSERDQSFMEATKTFYLMRNWYRLQGYEIRILPQADVYQRARFILNEAGISHPGGQRS